MYWLVSLPLLDDSEERAWTLVQNRTTYESDLSSNYKFVLPELRVGTLDSLMVLSDDLVKVNGLVESVVNKVRRQLFEMGAVNGSDSQEVTVEGVPPDTYLERFAWNEAKYPPRRPLKETVAAITETAQKLEDELKVRMGEYNQLKGQLTALARKAGGSLAVRDLGGILKPGDLVDTENLTTLFVVVPVHTKGEWLSSYETLSDFVVPRSSKLVAEDSDLALYSVALFKRVADGFKAAARSKGFQVREYSKAEEAEQAEGVSGQADLREEANAKRRQMEQWSASAYGEAFSAWIHICAVRLFVESILRYGLPPKFLAALMKPNQKSAPKLRKLLSSLFGSQGTNQFYDGEGGVGEAEMFPYVSFSISVDG
ncbi:hypothetical protein WJX81_004823 [Elliptochloris bilobata]|uniref:V-type proton ATPase subunit C n=1 Tax=Elliptochloris bilobata TaxID=381761 RepID=A0AAW1S0C4_9CHLO